MHPCHHEPDFIAHSPFEGPKDDRGRDCVTHSGAAASGEIIPIHGQRDKAGEPKQHGQRIQGEDGILVGEAREHGRGEGEVGQHQQGPHGDEDHEADFRRSIGEGKVIPPVRRCHARRISTDAGSEGWDQSLP